MCWWFVRWPYSMGWQYSDRNCPMLIQGNLYTAHSSTIYEHVRTNERTYIRTYDRTNKMSCSACWPSLKYPFLIVPNIYIYIYIFCRLRWLTPTSVWLMRAVLASTCLFAQLRSPVTGQFEFECQPPATLLLGCCECRFVAECQPIRAEKAHSIRRRRPATGDTRQAASGHTHTIFDHRACHA